MQLLHKAMPAYELQIAKAIKRGDIISINHRVAAFMESYFDVIFAVNELTHPGEKRLIQICKETCKILPEAFEESLNKLFTDLFLHEDVVANDLACIIERLQEIL